jgi:hypothetical protein
MRRLALKKVDAGCAASFLFFLSFLFISCEKEIGGGGTMRISVSVSEVAYGKNDNGVRSAFSPKSESVMVPIDGEGNLCLYATLEEYVAGKKPELRAFTPNARVRIAAYDGSNVLQANVIGKFSNKVFTPDDPTAWDALPSNATYTFVAYSVNSTTEDPDDYRSGEVLANIDPSKDLLYGKSDPTYVSSGDNSVVIKMKHKFSQVKVTMKSEVGAAAYITDMEAVLKPGYTADLPLIGSGMGTLIQGLATANPQEFDFTIETNQTEVTSEPRTVYTDEAAETRIGIPTMTVEGVNGGVAITNMDDVVFSFPLEYSTSYSLTILLAISSTGRWAGSNIYWDGGKLTFDGAGKTANKTYQGVFFRWGSLIGISPQGGTDVTSLGDVRLYIPPVAGGDWDASKTVGSTDSPWSGAGSWASIPYTTTASSTNAEDENYLYEHSDAATYAVYKGDICKYLTGGIWRMPNASEFRSGSYTAVTGSIPSANAAGTESITSGFTGNYTFGTAFFPQSNYRWHNTGFFGNGGAYYWCGSAWSDEIGWVLNGTGMDWLFRYFGVPVRCVKN